jgi:predicted GNAT family acetyltransferase
VRGAEQAVLLNVYTQPAWRRRGIAERLVREVLAWAAARGVSSVVLHASAAGRRLYERLGFAATNEMIFRPAAAPPSNAT